MEKYINLDSSNIENEHLCCAISDKKHQIGVNLKKEWLKIGLSNGHVFRKLDCQGKVFIEYDNLEDSFVPILGDNYIYIYCLWVAGSFKNKGYGSSLIQYCIDDAKNKKKDGICVITSKKKSPFLSDKKFFMNNNFKVVDSVLDYELLALSFNGENPKFSESTKKLEIDNKDLTIYYSLQCPYISNCINEITKYCKEENIKCNFILVKTSKEAKQLPCVFNNFAIFNNGKFVTTTIMNVAMLKKIL